MNQGKKQFVEAGMLIRKPVEQVFGALKVSLWCYLD